MLFKYPNNSTEVRNLDWMIIIIKELTNTINTFTALQKIKWCGNWDISKAYEQWSIVDTPEHDGYISIKPVPIGVNITNSDYWVKVCSYDVLYASFESRIKELEDKTYNYVTPIMYGAKGDGVTDDTVAIQNAINQTETNTIMIPSGKYHTTSPIILRDGVRIIGASRGSTVFLNSFASGTFTLANDVFIENITFESDINVDGYSFYGNGTFAVNINMCDLLGGSFNNTDSMFIKMRGDFSTLMMNDCVVDSGTKDGYAIDLVNNSTTYTENRDVQMRNVFVDTWHATTGASIFINNIWVSVLNNCIVRGSGKGLILKRDNAIVPGISLLESEFTLYDQGDLVIEPYCTFRNHNSTIMDNVKITLGGIIDSTNEILTDVAYHTVGMNAFTFLHKSNNTALLNLDDGRVSLNCISSPNKSLELSLLQHYKNLTDFDYRINLDSLFTADGDARTGIYFSDGTNVMLFGICGFNIVVDQYSDFYTLANHLYEKPFRICVGDLWLRVKKKDNNYYCYISNDGNYWHELFRSVTSITASSLGIAISDVNTGNDYDAIDVTISSSLLY